MSDFPVSRALSEVLAPFQALSHCHAVDSLSRGYLDCIFDDQSALPDPSRHDVMKRVCRDVFESMQRYCAQRKQVEVPNVAWYDASTTMTEFLSETVRCTMTRDEAGLRRLFPSLNSPFLKFITETFFSLAVSNAFPFVADCDQHGCDDNRTPHAPAVAACSDVRAAAGRGPCRKLQDGVCRKKQYELDMLAPFVHSQVVEAVHTHRKAESVCDHREVVLVDIGAGQGYLSARLAVDYGYTIVAVERNGTQLHGSIQRAQISKLLLQTEHERRQTLQQHACDTVEDRNAQTTTGGSLHVVAMDVDCNTDATLLQDKIEMCLNAEIENKESHPVFLRRRKGQTPLFAVISLHACGSLSHNMLRLFSQWRPQRLEQQTSTEGGEGSKPSSSQIGCCVACVNVGCCYNLISTDVAAADAFPMSHAWKSELSTFSSNFELRTPPERAVPYAPREGPSKGSDGQCSALTRNMLMTASQTPHRWYSTGTADDVQEASLSPERVELESTFHSLYQRALLQLAFVELLGVDDLTTIGRVPSKRQRDGEGPDEASIAAGCSSDKEEREFVHYAMWGLRHVAARCPDARHRLEALPPSCDEGGVVRALCDLYRRSRVENQEKEKMACMWMVRVLVGHCLEAFFMSDRAHYLMERLDAEERGHTHRDASVLSESERRSNGVSVIALFDPRQSPRYIAVVARR